MRVKLPVREAILNRHTYEAPAEGRSDKLRLDFNENTTGCSPAVRRALAKLTTKQLAMYPEYQAPTRRIAHYFGVRPQELLLTNGGDDALRVFFDTFVEPGSTDVPLLRGDLRRAHFRHALRQRNGIPARGGCRRVAEKAARRIHRQSQ